MGFDSIGDSVGMTGQPDRVVEEPLYRQWPSRFWRGLILFVVVVAAVGIPGLYYFRFSDAATRTDAQHQAERQQARTDCARVVANEQQGVKDDTFVAKARLDVAQWAALSYVLQGGTAGDELDTLVADADSLRAMLDKAIFKQEALPLPAKVVERTCPSV